MEEEELCVVCAEALQWVGYGHCAHLDVCSLCILRLRFLVEDKSCCICKQQCPAVFVTKALGDYTTKIEDFSGFPVCAKEGKVNQYWFHKDSQAYFDDEEQYNTIKAMCRLCCSICESMSEEAGKGSSKRVINFEHIDQLKRHLFHVHNRSLCELCLQGQKVFICEQKLYTQAQLDRHLSRGDLEVDGSERQRGGFMGHPMCNFCKKRFYRDNELHQHMSTEHYTCHICQRMNPGHYEYYQNYDKLEVHFRQQHFLCENAACLAKKFVVFVSESQMKRHNALHHSGNMSRSQRNAALQIPICFQYRRQVNEQSSHQCGRRQRHNANDHATAAIQGHIDPSCFGNAICESSMMRETNQNAANPLANNLASSSLEIVSSLLTSTGSNIPSRYLKTESGQGVDFPVEDSTFPPLPVAPRSAEKKAEITAQRCGKTLAAHLRNGRCGAIVVNRAELRENRQHSSPSSGQLSSSVSVTSAVSQVNAASNIYPNQRTVSNNSGIHSCPLPSPDFIGGKQANADNFPPICGKKSVCTVSGSEKQNSGPSSMPSLSKQEMHLTNKALVKHIWSILGENDKQFAAFKNVSAQYRHGQIDAQSYYSCISQFGLSDFILELVRLCPDPQKQKELLEIHNVNIQKNTKNSALQTNTCNTFRKEKSEDGGSYNADTTSSSTLSSIDHLKQGRKPSDKKVEPFSKDGYWAVKGKTKIWETNDPSSAFKASCSLNEAENNSISEILVKSGQSSVPASSTDEIDSTDTWSCLVCTLINEIYSSYCLACGMAKPENKSKNESNFRGKEKRKKKTSKFQRVQLGDGSAASLLSLGHREHSFEDNVKGTSGNTERLSSHSVWSNGGGQRLVALAQRETYIDTVWNSSR